MSFPVKSFMARIFSCMAFLTAVAVLTVPSVLLSQPATGTNLSGSREYLRLVRLAHGSHNGTIVASDGEFGNIWQSTNNGGSWTQVGTVSPSLSGCCATLFEMPQTVGSLTAGTLLYGATYTQGTQRAIKIYTSTNAGSTWT